MPEYGPTADNPDAPRSEPVDPAKVAEAKAQVAALRDKLTDAPPAVSLAERDAQRTARAREIRARLDAATAGPWEAAPNGRVYGQPRPEHADERDVADTILTADAELIAHAPQDLSRLLAEVRRLQAELAEECRRRANLSADLNGHRHMLVKAGDRADAAGAERDALAARLDAVWAAVRDSQAEQTVLDTVQGIVTGVHFAPYGGSFTTCGQALPQHTPWSVNRGEFDSSLFTTRRSETTCPRCLAALDGGEDPAEHLRDIGVAHDAPGVATPGDGTWGAIRTACHGCGPLDEYAAPWPCPTARALDVDQATPTPDWADVRAAARDAGFTLLRDHDHKIRSWRYRQNGQTFTASLTYDPGHLLQSATWHASIRANRRYVEIDGPTPAEVLAAARLTRLDGDDHA